MGLSGPQLPTPRLARLPFPLKPLLAWSGMPSLSPAWLAPVTSGHWGVGLPEGALLTALHLERGWDAAQRRALPRGSHHNGESLCAPITRTQKDASVPLQTVSTSRARKGWDSLYLFSTGWLQRMEMYSPTILESRSPQPCCW